MDRRDEHLIEAFASTLRRVREQVGLTQEDLAERADVSVRFVSFLETGKRQPSLSALGALSRGLGMSMSELVAPLDQGSLHNGQANQMGCNVPGGKVSELGE
ncbi:helix-turn-helix domain-containing protein [Paracoccus benzoatiresistens]|uniref:Helix-turn-helix transcriptional regulator n=1 Tax=Paracoccus benzoatiresistens TaxID=2997341 RepID=A0ABT4J9S2_9RHOB|nr:helix-turn-helix transcriptional regulator [Paracoccus sp. EF6]MCZ0963877.1 helix-turn-helix transcriptional regulator [Paracoccus sp. EF6]